MKKVWLVSVVVFAALVVVFAQPAWAADSGTKATKKQAGKPGAVAVTTVTVAATVDAVDAAQRIVTLKWPDGKIKTLKAGPEVRNFDQIRVGDQVKSTFVEELAVFVKKSDALAPLGAKPGVVMADTRMITAKIEAVNYKNRTVTLKGPEGNTKTLKVGKNVKNFKDVKKGDEVAMRYTEAMAIIVEKP